MNITRMLALVGGCVASTGLSAVDHAAVTQTKPGAAVRVTVIGCVRRASPPPGSDTTAIPAGGTRYLLSNIMLGGDRATTAEGGGSRGDLVAQNVTSYQLDAAAASKIASHVGERVEVQGTVMSAPPAAAGTSGRELPSTSAASAPRLRVETIKTIAKNSSVCAQ